MNYNHIVYIKIVLKINNEYMVNSFSNYLYSGYNYVCRFHIYIYIKFIL